MRFLSPSTFSRLSLLGALGALGAMGCTASLGEGEFEGKPAAGSGGTSGGGSSGSGGSVIPPPGGSAGTAGTGTAGTAGAGGTNCVDESTPGQLTPIDIFIMLDRSGSMHPTKNDAGADRWGQVTSAIKAFVSAPVTGEVGVGIDFFPEQGLGLFDRGCDVKFYSNPSVGVAPLPGVGAKITNAINQTGPDGATPLAEALEGAVTYAGKVKAAKQGHEVVIVLATDGDPMGCNEKMSAVGVQAAKGVQAGVKTFVIGVGSDVSNLDGVAKAGGTGTALMADDGSDLGARFQAKLDEIRGTVACEFQIPAPKGDDKLDFNKVNVNFTPQGGTAEHVGRTPSGTASDCGETISYHYDNPDDRKKIILCPKACERIRAEKGAVTIAIGCESIITPPPS